MQPLHIAGVSISADPSFRISIHAFPFTFQYATGAEVAPIQQGKVKP
jgi:hypothetical protein